MNHTYRRDVLITSYKYYYSNSYFISSSFFSQHRMIQYYSNPYNTGRTAVRVREHKAFFFRFLLFLCLFLFVFNLTMIILFVDQIVFLLQSCVIFETCSPYAIPTASVIPCVFCLIRIRKKNKDDDNNFLVDCCVIGRRCCFILVVAVGYFLIILKKQDKKYNFFFFLRLSHPILDTDFFATSYSISSMSSLSSSQRRIRFRLCLLGLLRNIASLFVFLFQFLVYFLFAASYSYSYSHSSSSSSQHCISRCYSIYIRVFVLCCFFFFFILLFNLNITARPINEGIINRSLLLITVVIAEIVPF